jgi:hypothetical protein
MDIRVNLKTKDIDISSGGSISLTGSPEESLQQRLFIKLNMFKNEWFLNTEFGVPYYQKILGQTSKLDVVNAILIDIITTTPDVASVDSFSSSLNAATREFTASFLVTSTSGNQIKVSI